MLALEEEWSTANPEAIADKVPRLTCSIFSAALNDAIATANGGVQLLSCIGIAWNGVGVTSRVM